MFDIPDPSPLFILCPSVIFLSVLIYFISNILAKRLLKSKTSTSQLISLIVTIGAFLVLCSLASMLLDTVYRNPPTPLFEPAKEELVGTWHLSENVVEYLQRKGYAVTAHELVLKEDGTFRMFNVPATWRYWDRSLERKYVTGSGIWRMTKLQYWSLRAKFQTMNGQASDESIEFWVVGASPPYSLLINLGEMNVGLVFQRE